MDGLRPMSPHPPEHAVYKIISQQEGYPFIGFEKNTTADGGISFLELL
jgi:hypothetical protein